MTPLLLQRISMKCQPEPCRILQFLLVVSNSLCATAYLSLTYSNLYNWLGSYFHHPKWFLGCPHHQNGPHPSRGFPRLSSLPMLHLPTRSRSQCLSENSCAKWSSIRRATSWQSCLRWKNHDGSMVWTVSCTYICLIFGMVNLYVSITCIHGSLLGNEIIPFQMNEVKICETET